MVAGCFLALLLACAPLPLLPSLRLCLGMLSEKHKTASLWRAKDLEDGLEREEGEESAVDDAVRRVGTIDGRE